MSFTGRRIAVLAGGTSNEREISLLSGQAVFDALSSKGLDTLFVDASTDFIPFLKKENISLVFNALHGSFGEDGTVQRLLDEAQIQYTGSGAEASELAFNKARAQELFSQKGIPVPEFAVITRGGNECPLPLPVVVKPAKGGSSIGITRVLKADEYEAAVQAALIISDKALVERYVCGRELTVGILDGRTLPIVEVVASRPFYDYEAKYGDAGTRYECPAVLSEREAGWARRTAVDVYRALGCRVMARVDILWDESPFVLEANTIPGLTSKSLLPKAARAVGIDFPDLCVKILELSLNKYKENE